VVNGAVSIDDGNKAVNREGTADSNQEVIFFDTVIVHYGSPPATQTLNPAQELFPFMTFLAGSPEVRLQFTTST
jgi:hypothetical protein